MNPLYFFVSLLIGTPAQSFDQIHCKPNKSFSCNQGRCISEEFNSGELNITNGGKNLEIAFYSGVYSGKHALNHLNNRVWGTLNGSNNQPKNLSHQSYWSFSIDLKKKKALIIHETQQYTGPCKVL